MPAFKHSPWCNAYQPPFHLMILWGVSHLLPQTAGCHIPFWENLETVSCCSPFLPLFLFLQNFYPILPCFLQAPPSRNILVFHLPLLIIEAHDCMLCQICSKDISRYLTLTNPHLLTPLLLYPLIHLWDLFFVSSHQALLGRNMT